MRIRILFFITTLITISSCQDIRIKEHDEWNKIYEKYGIKNACFILRDNNHESIYYLNKQRCTERLLPASTFKIFNSLVALETAVAPDDDLVIKWDGTIRRDSWNKDMSMREAFKESCLPYYQEIARRIGQPKLQHYLDTCKYGNMKIGGKVDEFWLNSSLQISADEQLGFIKKMYFNELPFSERTQRIVKTMMLQEEKPHYNLYYKTGTGMVGDTTIYWIVGFIEKIEHMKELEGSMNKTNVRNYPYFFAQNFKLPTADTSKNWFEVRKTVLHEVLKEYGALVE